MSEDRSPISRDPWELELDRLIGHPNGAHTQPTIVQAQDWYKNVTAYMIQTVKWEKGDVVFLTLVNGTKSERFILPPSVLAAIDRQRAAVTTMVRRRHGQRLAESQKAAGRVHGFTPEMRAKAARTRAAKAERKRKRASR
jgi:hypothetical protein